MTKLYIYTILFFFIVANGCSQEFSLTKSGYSLLNIELSGDYPQHPPFTIPQCLSSLSSERPLQFHAINDSTYQIKFFSFGPSSVHFQYDNQYICSLILPEQLNIIKIHYESETHYKMNFMCEFNTISEHSNIIAETVMESFSYSIDSAILNIAKVPAYADSLRKLSLESINQYQNWSQHKPFDAVLDRYIKDLSRNLRREKLIEKLNNVNSEDSFLTLVISKTDADTNSLLTASYNLLLQQVIRDDRINKPDLVNSSPNQYLLFLQRYFKDIFTEEHNLFYDMVIAAEYIRQIEFKHRLDPKQIEEIQHYFKNNDLSDYIIHQNNLSYQDRKQVLIPNYLPFDKNLSTAFDDSTPLLRDTSSISKFLACRYEIEETSYFPDHFHYNSIWNKLGISNVPNYMVFEGYDPLLKMNMEEYSESEVLANYLC